MAEKLFEKPLLECSVLETKHALSLFFQVAVLQIANYAVGQTKCEAFLFMILPTMLMDCIDKHAHIVRFNMLMDAMS